MKGFGRRTEESGSVAGGAVSQEPLSDGSGGGATSQEATSVAPGSALPGGGATPAQQVSAPGPIVEPQPRPEDIPVDFDHWARTLKVAWRNLLAGYRHHVRVQGVLLTKRSLIAWQTDFEAWASRPVQ